MMRGTDSSAGRCGGAARHYSRPRRLGLTLMAIMILSAPLLHATASRTNAPGKIEFFVSPFGNDQWSGKLEAANSSKTDGPFATVSRAFGAVRVLRQPHVGLPPPPARIQLRGGNFFLSEPLVMRPEDSGLTLEAYSRERPVISGGRRITGWRERIVEGREMWGAPP